MKRTAFVAGCLGLLLACGRDAAVVEPGWRLEPAGVPGDSLTIGDPLRVRLTGSFPRGARLEGSPWDGLSDQWSLRTAREPARRTVGDSMEVWTQEADLAPFATGSLAIGPLPIRIVLAQDTLVERSDVLAVEVASVLADSSEMADLRDIKPPIPLGSPRWPYAAAAAALLALAAVAAWMIRRRRKREAEGPPLLAPWEEFRRALEDLESRRLPETGDWGRYTLELGWTVRRYLERTFGEPVLEMTTGEVRGWLRGMDFSPVRESRMLRWLDRSDLIKFAKAVPTLGECRELMGEARDLVRDVETSRGEIPAACEPLPAQAGVEGAA